VQFRYGKSLHKVDLTYIKGTTVMPSKEDKKQGTFTEKYILPYSLIVFYGVVNENAASSQNINLTERDIDLLLEAMWNGTKNLLTASKVGQIPRLLLQIIYKEKNFHIGELDNRISFISDKDDKQIRGIKDGKIEVGNLISTINNSKNKIEKIRIKIDENTIFTRNGAETDLRELLSGFLVEELNFMEV
jgi:CRISPR-associated protein Csh2